MTDHVWVSAARTDSMLILDAHTDIFENDRARAVEAEKRNGRGEFVPLDMCPTRVWLESMDRPDLPDMFLASGQWIVSACVAEILRKFDLGNGVLHPIAGGVFRRGSTTPIAGAYFSWIFGNVKRAFLEAHSPTARAVSGGGRDWCAFPFKMSDGAIAVSRDALAGPDVWVDPLLFKSIFVSGALGDAMDAARLRKTLCLFTCPVIS